MSYQSIELVRQKSKSRNGALLLMLAVAHRADTEGRIRAPLSLTTLAIDTRRSERQIERILLQLEHDGELEITWGRGRGQHHRFRILLGSEKATFLTEVSKMSPFSDEKGDIFDTEKATFLTEKGDIFDIAYKDDRTTHRTADLTAKNPLPQADATAAPKSDEEDDLAGAFRSDLAQMAGRSLIFRERQLVNDTCATAEGRECMATALDRMRARWPEIRLKHDLSLWLEPVLFNLKYEGAPAPQDPLRYALDSSFDADLPPLPPPREPTPAEALWDKTLGELKLQLANSTYYTWLHNTDAIAGDDDSLTVMTKNSYGRDWLENRLMGVVERTLKSIAGRSIVVTFVVDEEEPGGPFAREEHPLRKESDRQAGEILAPEGGTGYVANLDRADAVVGGRAGRAFGHGPSKTEGGRT